jgi:type II secretory pathway pseudopilin PulG
MKHLAHQAGYTLIELLLYISIISILFSSVMVFYDASLKARVKNQSILEVEQQGKQIMDTITQAIRSADSITAPTAGNTGSQLTLAMPSSAANPTILGIASTAVMGYNTIGSQTDTDSSNNIHAVRFTAPASGTITTLSAYVGASVGSSPNNLGQMAIYSGTVSGPTTLIGSTGDSTLTANSWVNFTLFPSVNVTGGLTYWLAYNTDGTNSTVNNLRYDTGASGQEKIASYSYDLWPASWPASTDGSAQLSMYATINVTGGNGAFEIKEGAGTSVPLTNSKIQMSSITFKNLSRSSTPGVVQVSFTLARVNVSNRTEYDYQKTFTATAALRWP